MVLGILCRKSKDSCRVRVKADGQVGGFYKRGMSRKNTSPEPPGEKVFLTSSPR